MINFTQYPVDKLPLPLLKKHKLKRNSGRIETKQQSGYVRSRVAFKSVPSEMPFAILVTSDQLEIFEGWYEHIIFKGTNWFVIPVKTGAVVEGHECQFMGDYDSTPISQTKWKVTAKMRIKDLRVISEDETIGRIHDVDQPSQTLKDVLSDSVKDYLTENS